MQLCKGTAVGQERIWNGVFSRQQQAFWTILMHKNNSNRECNYLVFCTHEKYTNTRKQQGWFLV